MKEREHIGFFYAILAAIASAAMSVVIKWTEAASLEVMIFIRFLVSVILLVPAYFQGKIQFTRKRFGMHLARAIVGLIAMYSFFYSIRNLDLVNALTLFYTAPLFLPLVIYFWLKKIIPPMRIVAGIIGFIGILIILRPWLEAINWAVFVGLIGALFFAIAQVGVRLLSRIESIETIMAYFFLISLVISFFFMLFAWEPIDSIFVWMKLILIGVLSYIFQYFYTQSLRMAPASKVSSVNYLAVVFGGIFGWFFFGESPSIWVLVGVMFIIAGGLIALFSEQEIRGRKN